MIFRKGGNNDFDVFYSFFRKSIAGHFPHYSQPSRNYIMDFDYPEKFLKEQLDSKKKHVILCFDDDRLVGYLLYHRQFAGVSFANWLAVDQEYRKKGIALTLLSDWEKAAFEEGAHVLQLWTNDHNLVFYRKRGFIMAGKFPKAWYGVDSYLFFKPLREPDEKNFLKSLTKGKK